MLELALENDVPAVERRIRLDELKGAAEIWLTSSTREILPVIELDGIPVGNSEPGPLWSRMQAVYQAYKQRLRTA